MDEKKPTLAKEVSDTMACTAYAEAGEPCPIGNEEKPAASDTAAETSEGAEQSTLKSVTDTMACAAYAEAGEPCPIDNEEKTAEPNTKK